MLKLISILRQGFQVPIGSLWLMDGNNMFNMNHYFSSMYLNRKQPWRALYFAKQDHGVPQALSC